MTRCFFCKGNMENSTTSYMTEVDGHYVIIKNVPCHKCAQCGEVSYSGVTMTRLEEIINEIKSAMIEVAVVEYAA